MIRPDIEIAHYTYDLPEERIAAYPAEKRDTSKLLLYNRGKISETIFSSLPESLSSDSLMIFNDTKVVPARLLFRRKSGAFIEIFCLEPHLPSDYAQAFAQTHTSVWKVIIGNKKKWKGEPISLYIPENHSRELIDIDLVATLESFSGQDNLVRFTWSGGDSFSRVLEMCGKIPIPPYLNRDMESIDYERYQTLYAKYRGSVAAPTAGLHFTSDVFDGLDKKGIEREEICLHVGAGTFLPVKSAYIADHKMHSEPFSISINTLKAIYNSIDNKNIVAVGTTSVRTLESLYYEGVRALKATPELWVPGPIDQWEPYNCKEEIAPKDAIGALIEYLELRGERNFFTKTSIIIVPSYRFHIVDQLITNFHQPNSTLLLLIAAFIGEDWRDIYRYALEHDFRFLSYGDSSLLVPDR